MNGYVDLPIAIVGVACRFPGGANSLDSLWGLLEQGRDAVRPLDGSRWDFGRFHHPRRGMPGCTVAPRAGLLDNIFDFDPAFFGISRTEAMSMDPQQRIMLELAWEALEDAGIPPSQLSGSDTAVFVGSASADTLVYRSDDACAATPYSMTGTNLSIISNRISYVYNFHGPSMTLDSACSSSMYALCEACQALASGRSAMAMAGGTSVLLSPFPYIGFSHARMLSADGACKVFDASGDGYVRAEGAGLVLLQPLEDALAQGRTVHAVIRATGCNSDGRTQGIALPSGEAQEALLRAVYGGAGLDPGRLAYVEAHGTGTAAGDPVECGAIGRALGQRRKDPLWVGSVKCNLGHLETASAMAGLMKALLVLRERRIPPQIHLSRINPAIDRKALNLRFPLRTVPLPRVEGGALVGVNSFGFGGSNGHCVLEAAPQTPAPRRIRAVPPLLLSAGSEASLQALAGAWAERIEAEPEAYYELAAGAALRREALSRRLAVEGSSPGDVARILRAAAAGPEREHPGAARGEVLAKAPEGARAATAFVFTGNGSQWAGMGRCMLENPAFRKQAGEASALMQELSGENMLELLAAAGPAEMAHTDVAQKLLFLVQVGLCAALRDAGFEADCAFGHSVGEVAAAWYCGALSLKEAVRVIHFRSLHQERTRGTGRMAAASVSAAEAAELAGRFGDVELAGVNAADAVTLSGSAEALEAVGRELRARRVFFRELPLDYAFHSTRMDAVRKDLLDDLRGLRTRAPRRLLISTVTGSLQEKGCPAAYWWENVRRPVQFHGAVQTALALGVRHFLEIGPHSILLRYLRSGMAGADCAGAGPVDGWAGGTLSRGGDLGQFRQALRLAWTHGWPADLARLFPRGARALPLPRYPWDRARCWLEPTPECARYIKSRADHPLLGRRLPREDAWENVVDLESSPWLGDHKVGASVFYPGAAFLEMCLAAARLTGDPDAPAEIVNFSIARPVVLQPAQPMALRTEVQAADGEIRILARPYMANEPWSLHCRGRIVRSRPAPRLLACTADPEGFGEAFEAEDLLSLTKRSCLDYGPVFRPVERYWRREGRVLARFAPASRQALQDGRAREPWEEGMLVPPPLCDGGIQLYHPLLGSLLDERPAPRIPHWFDRCVLFRAGRPVFAALTKKWASADTFVYDLSLLDAAGREILRIEGGQVRTVDRLAKPRPGVFATFPVPLPHPSAGMPEGLPAQRALAEELRAFCAGMAEEPQVRRRLDEVLPLREICALALARELAGRGAGAGQGACPPELACLLEERLEAYGPEVAESLPSFADAWRTLFAASPASSAACMLLASCGAALLEGGAPTPPDSPLWEECLRQERRDAARLAARALELLAQGASSPLRILDACSGPAGARLLAAPCLAGHARALAAPDGAALAELRLALAGRGGEPGDAPVELVCWDPAKEDPPFPCHVALAFHCLHRAADVVQALRGLRRALPEGGRLLIAEEAPSLAGDALFGQLASWWDRAGGAPASRLLEPGEWRRALAEAGFAGVEELRLGEASPEFLLVAEAGPAPQAAQAVQADSRTEGEGSAVWAICQDGGCPGALQETLDRLAAGVQSGGGRAVRVRAGSLLDRRGESWSLDPASPAHWKAVWESLAGLGSRIVLVDAMGFGAAALDARGAEGQCGALIQCARGWDRAGRPRARLALLTCRALPGSGADGALLRPAQACAAGAARVLMNEMPGLDVCIVDVHGCEGPGAPGAGADGRQARALAGQLLRELREPTAEREVVLEGARRFALRSRGLPAAGRAAAGAGGARRLACLSPGFLESLRWQDAPLEEPGPGQVRVAARAVGLNFRDVMWAMNMLPEEALANGFSGPGLGIECAGVVEAAGPGVADLAPGDRVLCFGPKCFASHVVTRASACAPLPEGWSFEEAATVPVAFFTAWYALHECARIQPGERVLIHGAAGGVGLAAVQIAQTLGAEIYATAGSDAKRRLLKLLGVERVYDSRSLSFRDRILEDTGGGGVDCVLNSLAGEGMDQSLRLLRPFGRFLELGKRDFYADSPLRLRPFRDNASFFGIDVDQLMKERPELGSRIFRELMERFAEGAWLPLPHAVYQASETEDAFRAMQQSRHVGKIVVVPPAPAPRAEADGAPALPVRPDASYVVVGGLGGFGLATARRLAERGAGALVLVSRRGQTPENAAEVEALRRLGLAEGESRPVAALAQDAAEGGALAQRLDEALEGLPPVAGVVHAAAVLDDASLARMTPGRFARVLRPKAEGAFSLHRWSRDKDLDFFLMYSSVTTIVGNPGQANYVAANMALESLAELRRAQGLPGLAVGWGAIGDAGMLLRNARARGSLARTAGIAPVTSAEALDAAERLSRSCPAAPVIALADWRFLARLAAGRTPRFGALRVEGEDEGAVQSLREAVAALGPSVARAKVEEAVACAAARILRVAPASVKPGATLAELGMDSLMTMELSSALEEMLDGQPLAGGVGAGATVRALAARAAQALGCGAGDAPGEAPDGGEDLDGGEAGHA